MQDSELSTTADARSNSMPGAAVAAIGGGLLITRAAATGLPSDEDPVRIPSTAVADPSATSRDEPDKLSLPSFREIQNIKSTTERIATYNSTRTHWAVMDSGLDTWLSQTFEKYPEYSVLKDDPGMSTMGSSYSGGNLSTPVHSRVQHSKTGSIGKILTIGGQSSSEGIGQPEFIPSDKRTSGSGKVGETLKGLGGKGKGLLERMGRGRLRGGSNEGVGN
jgi:hypothetical protein